MTFKVTGAIFKNTPESCSSGLERGLNPTKTIPMLKDYLASRNKTDWHLPDM
jgi:hypothetical protein